MKKTLNKIEILKKKNNGTYCWINDDWFPVRKRSGYFVAIREYKSYLWKNEYAGIWKDPKTNIIYLDAVVWVKNENEAIKLARVKKQLAIWDIKNQKEIWIMS